MSSLYLVDVKFFPLSFFCELFYCITSSKKFKKRHTVFMTWFSRKMGINQRKIFTTIFRDCSSSSTRSSELPNFSTRSSELPNFEKLNNSNKVEYQFLHRLRSHFLCLTRFLAKRSPRPISNRIFWIHRHNIVSLMFRCSDTV